MATSTALEKLRIEYVPIVTLRHAEHNARVINESTKKPVLESIRKHGVVDPLIVNRAPGREGVVIGGNLRFEVLKELEYTEAPVVYLTIPDLQQEKDLCLRLNRAVGEWSDELLKLLDADLLTEAGFTSEELDRIFDLGEEHPEVFNLEKELAKLDIKKITVEKGDVYEWPDGSRVMCGDSCIDADMLKLMQDEKADLCLTDPPYLLDYTHGKKKHGTATEGFGLKRDRKYLETDTLPENFTDLWMANVAKVQKPDFSIIVYENPKNLRTIWNALEQHWRYRNTIVWHVPNRVQGFSAKYKFFNKNDIALVGTAGKIELNLEPEPEELLQNEYETALYATSGKPHWEGYERGKKYQPTDFIEHVAADEKSSGQGIIFGTKPLPILIPYIKVLTKRGDLVLEPFGGSGSTAAAAATLKRRFRLMEKSPVYAQVILRRLERLIGSAPKKV